MAREHLLATTFAELADTLDDEFTELDLLQRLVDHCTELFDASAAAVVLTDQRGDLQQVASTSHAARILGVIALSISHGPTQDSFRSGEPIVNVPEVRAAVRWPRFTRVATDLGFHSVHVFPLRYRNEVLGALSLLFEQPTRLSSADVHIGAALGRVTSIGLLQERTPRQKERLAERLQHTLGERVLLEQAKGVVAQRAGVTVDTAFAMLLAFSRTRSRGLGDVARGVLDGSLEVNSPER